MRNRQRQRTFLPFLFPFCSVPSLPPPPVFFFWGGYGFQTWFLSMSVDVLSRHSEEKPPVSVVLGGNRDTPSGVKVCRLGSLSLCLGLESLQPPPTAVPSESVDFSCQAQPKHSPLGKGRGCSHNCSLTFHLLKE